MGRQAKIRAARRLVVPDLGWFGWVLACLRGFFREPLPQDRKARKLERRVRRYARAIFYASLSGGLR